MIDVADCIVSQSPNPNDDPTTLSIRNPKNNKLIPFTYQKDIPYTYAQQCFSRLGINL